MLGYHGRKAFYDAKARGEKYAKESAQVVKLVNNLRHDQPRGGTRKLYPDLKPALKKVGLKIGRDKVHKILKEQDLLIKPKKKYVTTTDSRHYFYKYKNRIKNLNLNQPEQVFVCDITYIRLKKRYAYLFLITDAYSKKIIGWSINNTMKVKDGLKAVKMAHKNRIYSGRVFHHSDRGIQYCTPRYVTYIKSKGMEPSMTEELHVYENAIAERVNGILKSEYGIGLGFNTLKEARSVIEGAINIYNNKRRHYSLHLLTPNFVHYNNPGIKIKTYKSKRNKLKKTN